MSHRGLAKYDYASEDCAGTASAPCNMVNVELCVRSRDGGSSNLVGAAPVSERVDNIDALPEIAHVP